MVLHVGHAFSLQRREMFIFEVLTTTRARSRSFCLGVKAIRAKKAKVHFNHSLRRDQHGIIAKHLT